MKISYPQLFLFMFQEHDVCEPHWLTFRLFLAVAELPIPELVKMNIYPKLPLKINYCIALAIIGCTSNPVGQSTFPCHKTNLFRFDTPFVCLSFLQPFFYGSESKPHEQAHQPGWYMMVGKEVSHALGLHRGLLAIPRGENKIEPRENPFTQITHLRFLGCFIASINWPAQTERYVCIQIH